MLTLNPLQHDPPPNTQLHSPKEHFWVKLASRRIVVIFFASKIQRSPLTDIFSECLAGSQTSLSSPEVLATILMDLQNTKSAKNRHLQKKIVDGPAQGQHQPAKQPAEKPASKSTGLARGRKQSVLQNRMWACWHSFQEVRPSLKNIYDFPSEHFDKSW